jgi:hypothetical protein
MKKFKESNLCRKSQRRKYRQKNSEYDKELKLHKEAKQNKRQKKRSQSKIQQMNAMKRGILPSETTNIL